MILTLFPLSLVGQSGKCISGNCVNGQGTISYPNGGKYVGEWKDGLLNGHGTFTGNDSSSFVGQWKDGTRHGKGVLFEKNGEIKSGTWVKGSLQQTRTVEEVSRFLKNKYPQFPGFDYQVPNPENTPKCR